MDRDARSFEIRIGSQFLRYPEYLGALLLAFVTLGVTAAFGVLRPVYVPAFFFVAFPVGLLQLVGGTLRVGPDGLLVRWAGRTRFIDTRSIARIETFGRSTGQAFDIGSNMEMGLVVHLRDGRAVRVALTLGRFGGWSTEEAKQLVERIEAIVAPGEAHDVNARVGARLARGSRDLAGWLGALRALGIRAKATLRDADVDSDALWTLASGSNVAPDVRVGAAVALAARGDEERTRLRVAAETMAEPRLRVALEAAAAGDDARIARAVARVRQ